MKIKIISKFVIVFPIKKTPTLKTIQKLSIRSRITQTKNYILIKKFWKVIILCQTSRIWTLLTIVFWGLKIISLNLLKNRLAKRKKLDLILWYFFLCSLKNKIIWMNVRINFIRLRLFSLMMKSSRKMKILLSLTKNFKSSLNRKKPYLNKK